jgi:hypothetical protein
MKELNVKFTYGDATDMITCVNCSGEFMQDWVKNINWPFHEFVEFAYSYFAGGDVLDPAQCSPNAKRCLVGKSLNSQQLLMAEILNLDTSDGAYRYNHGKAGWSWNEAGFQNPSRTAYSPNPAATGRSQLFGDGHVRWRRTDSRDNLPVMSNPEVEEWNGPGSGWLGTYDTGFF